MQPALSLSFAGPFSWLGAPDAPCVLDAGAGQGKGIYLWTVPQQSGHLVYYVGETGRRFSDRLLEHYKGHAAAMYHVYEPQAFSRGEKIALWPGRYGVPERKTAVECIASYKSLCGPIGELTRMLRFFLAPLESDRRLRHWVEAAISQALFDVPGLIGGFQDKGIRYQPRRSGEAPVECSVTSQVPLLGLPGRLLV